MPTAEPRLGLLRRHLAAMPGAASIWAPRRADWPWPTPSRPCWCSVRRVRVRPPGSPSPTSWPRQERWSSPRPSQTCWPPQPRAGRDPGAAGCSIRVARSRPQRRDPAALVAGRLGDHAGTSRWCWPGPWPGPPARAGRPGRVGALDRAERSVARPPAARRAPGRQRHGHRAAVGAAPGPGAGPGHSGRAWRRDGRRRPERAGRHRPAGAVGHLVQHRRRAGCLPLRRGARQLRRPPTSIPAAWSASADTVYVCAPARYQELVAPIVVAFLEQVRAGAVRHRGRRCRRQAAPRSRSPWFSTSWRTSLRSPTCPPW